jgi:hypothetical protein
MGFSASFYGFFVAAALWLVGYFAWAVRAARSDRDRERR